MRRIAASILRTAVLMGLCLLFLWLGGVPRAMAEPPLRIALFIGNNQPADGVSRPLKYAASDAVRQAMEMRALSPGAEIVLLVSPEQLRADAIALERLTKLQVTPLAPTYDNVKATFKQISRRILEARRTGRRTELIVYLAAHGAPDGSVHLEGLDYLEPEALRKQYASLEADLILEWQDICYGAESFGEGGKGRLPKLAYVAARSKVPELEILRGGLLTFIAASGLYGPADRNLDGKITVDEFTRYIETQVGFIQDELEVATEPSREGAGRPLVDLGQLQLTPVTLEPGFPEGLVL